MSLKKLSLISKKKRKLSLRPGLQNESVSIRDIITEKNVLIKSLKQKPFRKYRNQIINFPRVSKQTYYNNYFEENKNEIKWT